MLGQSTLFGGQAQHQPQPQQQQQQISGFSLFNKPSMFPNQTQATQPTGSNITNQPTTSLFPQTNSNAPLFGQQTQSSTQTNLPVSQNQLINPTGTNILNQPSITPNLPSNKANLDFFHSKLSTQKISKESQDEMYSKLVKQYNDFSKNNNLKGHMQLESLDLNLDSLDQMILPDYLKFKKSLFQLVALTDLNKKDIIKSTNAIESSRTQAFLGDQGINIAKLDKDINEIKNYLISNYDFSQDLNKINLSSDKNIIEDRVKMHLSSTTNALWAKTNDNIIFTDNTIKLKKKDLNYFKKMAKLQNTELENLAVFSGSTRDHLSTSSNVQSANKFVQGGSTNKFLFGSRVPYISSAGRIDSSFQDIKVQNKPTGKSEKGSGTANSANFTPLKPMNLNLSTSNFNANRFKNVNNLSSDNYNIGSRKAADFNKNQGIDKSGIGARTAIFGMQSSKDSYSKAKPFSTLDYIDNLRMVYHKNIGIDSADETQIFQFCNYFENLKSYFYYKLKNEIIIENQPLLITNNDIENFWAVKDPKQKNNILPISINITKLCLLFEKDLARKNIFNLIFSQIKPNNSWQNSNITSENVLANTIKFYESEFLTKIFSQGDILHMKNKTEADIHNMDFDSKYICIEKFACNLIFQNFSTGVGRQASFMGIGGNQSNIVNYSKSDLERMKKWAIIYIFLRSGLIKDCIIYLSNLIKISYEELSINNYTGFGTANIRNYSNPDFISSNKDQDLEIFYSLLKQIYSDNRIDENLYSLLSEKIKMKNLKDLEPFKYCCCNLILKINQPVNENIFLNFEDYVWYHLNLVYKKNNFLELIQVNSIRLNYLSLDDFQDFIKQNDPNIFNNKNNPDFYLDYTKCLFSLLLFEDGIRFLMQSNKNIIDAFYIGYILGELFLLRNFSEEELPKNLTDFKSDQMSDILKNQINTFTNKISDKNKLFEIMLFIKFIFFDEVPQKTLDLYIILINKFGFYSFLLNGKRPLIDVEDGVSFSCFF